ncbi:MAG TPA: 3-phosphoshikimate 1-carboxyvinyltransferase [Armatimonadota bacterium]|jgi:3-phosphoshikimate 1-carboxyvinyltransferase
MSVLPIALEVIPHPVNGAVAVPSSKSYTNRALLLASLAEGDSVIRHPLQSDDAEAMTEALRALGVDIEQRGEDVVVHGRGRFLPPAGPIDCRDSGTTIRFLTAACALFDFPVTLTGSIQLQRRPLGPLLDALRALGVEVSADRIDGCPPVTVRGPIQPAAVSVDASKSSQYASALLMALGAAGAEGSSVRVDNLVSRPYVEMTLDSMAAFGVRCALAKGVDTRFRLVHDAPYGATDYAVEFDASAAGHILAAAALAGGEVTIAPAAGDTRQPDFRLVKVLAHMGCTVRVRGDSVSLSRRGPLQGAGTVDMRDWPDMLSTVAVVAAFAHGATAITGVAHARLHETDRIAATATELRKMGVTVVERPDGLSIFGGHPHGARIQSYGDHRMAMSFAAAGAAIHGMIISDPGCVRKTYPHFWDDLRAIGIESREPSAS